MADVSLTVGSVMEMLTVRMDLTKTQPFVIKERVTRTQNLAAKMEDAFQNYGCVISTTIVEMIQMNLPTCAGRRIAQLDGRGVQVDQITDVFLNGCSVMAKMTAETVPMNCLKIVHLATPKLTLNVPITDAFQNNGSVTSLTIVEMDQMRLNRYVKEIIENALNLNLGVTMENVYLLGGDATMKMIAGITLMKWVAADSNVKTEHSSVHLGIVLLHISVVMVTGTVEICLMK